MCVDTPETEEKTFYSIIYHCQGYFQRLLLGVCIFDFLQCYGFLLSACSDLLSMMTTGILQNYPCSPHFSQLNDLSYCLCMVQSLKRKIPVFPGITFLDEAMDFAIHMHFDSN